MAEHSGVMIFVGAILFGAFGLWYGSDEDANVSWLNSSSGGVLGMLIGGLLGYGMSIESRRPKPKGWRRALVIGGVLLCFAVAVGMRYVRYKY